jgi:hypothetical protein
LYTYYDLPKGESVKPTDFPFYYDEEDNVELEVVYELINRKRQQILIHSILYYRFNTSLIPDHTYDEWARELVQLQSDYPDIASQVRYADVFKDYDGSTGYDLPVLPNLVSRAYHILNYANKLKMEEAQ